jgi:Domain of unknown function (DUF4129)
MAEDQALERLREILARPEYQVDRSVPWWQQLFGPVLDLIGYLASRLVQILVDSATGQQGVLGLAVLTMCAVLLLVVTMYLVRAIRLSVSRDTRLATVSLSERRERSDRLWQSAQQLIATGQFTDAVRLLYLSALYALDEHAVIHVETSLTNREHAGRLMQRNPVLGRGFADLVNQYDRVRYGDYIIGSDGVQELSDLVARVRSAALAMPIPRQEALV